MEKILIVIPNYNGYRLISKNLEKVIEHSREYGNISIVIVDDGSKKEEVEKLEEFLSQKQFLLPVKLIKHLRNQGFSSAVDTGAFSEVSDFIFFLNSDAVPEKGYLQTLLEDFQNDPDLFAVGCMDKSIEGESVVLRGRGVAKWQRGMLVHSRGEVDEGTDTFWVSGGSSMVDAKKFRAIDGFDKIFNPFYWEDIDLSYRARKAGYKIIFEKRSIVEHRHDEGAIKTHYNKKRIQTIAYRNQFVFIWKDMTDYSLLLSHWAWFPYHLLNALRRMDTAFLKGFLLALAKFPDIIEKRRKQKKYFCKSDAQILFKKK